MNFLALMSATEGIFRPLNYLVLVKSSVSPSSPGELQGSCGLFLFAALGLH